MTSAVPLSTYRVQLTKDFGFDAAARVAPYLASLGITHFYASPFLKARPGSTHGYDIVDHERINPELGGEEGFARFSAALRENGLKLILDFVPNHMGVGHADNQWWLDVLEWGPRSPHATAFDIEWDALPHRRHPGILLPILGRPYGDALQHGEIEIKFDPQEGSFAAWYFTHKLPINPQRYAEMLRTIVASAHAQNEPAGRTLLARAEEYAGINRPGYREAPDLKRKLREVDGAAAVIERGLGAYSSTHESGSTALHRLLERQHYRLAYWRVAFSGVNYRRFFDISDLAGLRVEHPATFRAVHALVARLIAADQLQGIRLDHIDGLRDPAQYTSRLSRLIQKVRGKARRKGPFYLLVEKILADGEPMPRLPGVAGTTGYEWLNVISRMLVDGRGLDPLESSWREFTGERASFAEIVVAAKQRVIETMLASEFTMLCQQLARIAAGHFSTRDYTIDRLRAALEQYVIAFPVYRTYVTAAGASPEDRQLIEDTIARARARWAGPDPDIFDFLRDAITLDLAVHPGYSAPRVRNFALKLQQLTGPLTAKALEDTAFYRYHRLLALNEVGGDPAGAALDLDGFHRRQEQRAAESAGGLTATATHDTKRGEDARARILALSELAQDWNTAVRGWRTQNAGLIRRVGGERSPSPGHEYMLYQALIGAWSEAIDADFVERMCGYAVKAAREGKEETSWTNPNESYEAGLQEFVRGLLDETVSGPFLASFGEFAARTSLLGALNGLSQLALKAMLPGVPDFYQGTELWDFSLVDPDNRRPVDFDLRRKELAAAPAEWAELAATWRDGRIKLALTRALLRVRNEFPEIFRRGAYEPLQTAGRHADHVVAFARAFKNGRLIIAVGRHFAPLTNGGRRWPATIEATVELGGTANYVDLIDNYSKMRTDQLNLAALFRRIPVCLLWRT